MIGLRSTLRGLARTPVFTIIAVLSLALGIGANTAIFSLLDQVLLRTLPVKNPEQIVILMQPGPMQGSVSQDENNTPTFSYPMFLELEKQQTSFTGIAAASSAGASLAYRTGASMEQMRLVSGDYFEVLGVQPSIGRVFASSDERAPVAVLSYSCWTTHFGSDPSMLNQTVNVNAFPLTLVGVAQRSFSSEKAGDRPCIFVPIGMKKEITPGWDGLLNRKTYWLDLFARLKPGITREQAEAAINIPYHAQVEQDIALLSKPSREFLDRFRVKRMTLKPGEYGRGGFRDWIRQPTLLLLAMTGMVLLIACANVANLQLARAAGRSREIAVRLAIGAARAQLIRQLLTEACLLALAGGAIGFAAANLTMRAVIASGTLSSVLSAQLDWRVLLFCFAVSVATGVLFGLYPALQSTRVDLAPTLKDQSGQSTASGSTAAFRKTLVTAQVAISMLLLISAGLFGKTLVNLRNIDLGLRTDHLLMFSVAPKLARYNDPAAAQLYQRLTERVAAIPGVRMVSTGMTQLMANSAYSTNITVPGYTPTNEDAADSFYDMVGPDYFRTLGIPLVAGREFSAADDAGAPRVVMVNESFVRHFFPDQNPLGRRFARGGEKLDMEIVGIVKDSKYADVKGESPRRFYTPYRQRPEQTALFFYVRTAIDPKPVGAEIRHVVAQLDSNLPVGRLRTMDDQIDEDLFAERMVSTLTVAFAALATFLAALGLYGVLAYNVARRTREIGVRMALGATPANVRQIVIREVAWMLAIGTVAGLASAAAAGKLVQSMLYGMKPWDVSIYGAAAIILWAIAVLAAYIPARRATSVDPLIALRYE